MPLLNGNDGLVNPVMFEANGYASRTFAYSVLILTRLRSEELSCADLLQFCPSLPILARVTHAEISR